MDVSATGIQPAEPPSREDALSKRLQTLRNRRDEDKFTESGNPPPPYTETLEGRPPHKKQAQPPPTSSVSGHGKELNPTTAGHGDNAANSDLRLDEEDRTLDEIVDGLDVEDDQWFLSEEEDVDDDDSKRVEELLARLKDDPEAQPPESADGEAKNPAKEHDDDDSEGEGMLREAGDVLSRALDELKLDVPAGPTEQASGPPIPDAETSRDRARKAEDDNSSNDGIPEDVHDRGSTPASLPKTPEDDDEAGLKLPTVPTKLVDPAPAPAPTSTGDPFEDSIASRLAALKGTPPVQTDAFGLPSAPTFQPENRPVPGVVRKAGYTDEDQKTWCIVCLEDGTVRCLGCDGDVYCARCWKEMHVGPSAGYDERGHSWEKFDRGRM